MGGDKDPASCTRKKCALASLTGIGCYDFLTDGPNALCKITQA